MFIILKMDKRLKKGELDFLKKSIKINLFLLENFLKKDCIVQLLAKIRLMKLKVITSLNILKFYVSMILILKNLQKKVDIQEEKDIKKKKLII